MTVGLCSWDIKLLYALHAMITDPFCEGKKVKMEVYGLVLSAKRHSPDFTELPPGHWTCSSVSHLNSLGRIQSSCHFRLTELFKHTSLHCPTSTRYPLTPGSRECTREQSALNRSTPSGHNSAQRGHRTRDLSLTQVSRACYQ